MYRIYLRRATFFCEHLAARPAALALLRFVLRPCLTTILTHLHSFCLLPCPLRCVSLRSCPQT